MADSWKNQPHWVLRFANAKYWELVGPDGQVKQVDGFGQRSLTVTVTFDGVPTFTLDGILKRTIAEE